MEKRHKDIIRTLVGKLRHILVGTTTDDGFTQGNLDRELERLGIAPDGTITPIDVLLNSISSGERNAYRVASSLLTPLPREQRITARHDIIERAAYTWINRLLALRAMEVRNLIESTLRGEEAYGGISEKLYFLRQDEAQRTSDADGGWWAVIEDACNEQVKALPGLFSLADPNAALRPAPKSLLQCIELVNGSQPLPIKGITLADLDTVFADPDAIGWAYQFYQEEAKAAIDAKCKRGGKAASRAELAAKTQLFTEPYMVQWLLQNSLGRSYHEAYPQSVLPASWDYYVTPETLNTAAPLSLASLTVLDPCMGSGHFLRAAFDMFVAMYREQSPRLSAKEIADTILSQHLFGIDLDPRAAQLAALTLYLRAWELVRAEQRTTRTLSEHVYIPPMMNLATTPSGLTEGALERHLQRAPQDEVFKPLLKSIFAGLEQADILGSLLRPREYLDRAIEDLLKPQTIELGFNPERVARRSDIRNMAEIDPAGLRNNLLETIANSFTIEAGNTSDVSVALFGREAEQGMRLLQILDRQYAVVVTNPPYLGSGQMDLPLRKYVETHYTSGKRDLSSSFIQRCLELCKTNGRVAMVTPHNWMFLRSYAKLRAVSTMELERRTQKSEFTGLLRETNIEVLAHLGPGAFEEIGGEVVQSVMFVLTSRILDNNHKIIAFRLVGLQSSGEKNLALQISNADLVTKMYQFNLLAIPEAPIVYWIRDRIVDILKSPKRINVGTDKIAGVHSGLCTGNNTRFIRYTWEIPFNLARWPFSARAGRYQKWWGLNYGHSAWRIGAQEYSETIGSAVRCSNKYFQQGVTYGRISSGAMGARLLWGDEIFEQASIGIIPTADISDIAFLSILNNRVTSYLLRVMTQGLVFSPGYVENLPYERPAMLTCQITGICVHLKKYLVAIDLLERSFETKRHRFIDNHDCLEVSSVLHTLEGMIETKATELYQLAPLDILSITNETGTPAGWYPLITNYDTLPTLPDKLDISPLPQELFDYLAEHKRIAVNNKELIRIKNNLKALYEAGPHAKGVEQEEREEASEEGDEEEMASGAHIPIPTETFLEELSVKMELHPISVYWLLEELRAEGMRCKPEEKRLLEDRLSVLVLRLLGHRWPKQLEAGEPVPMWADEHGIIPLVAGTSRATLAERVRERLQSEDGALETQQTEALLHELTRQTLEQWLHRSFFSNHIKQFKSRPIAWHLASTPIKGEAGSAKKKRGEQTEYTTRGPAFECLLYYHACSRSALTRIRTQYVEPLLQVERERVEQGNTTHAIGGIQQEALLADTESGLIVQAKLRIRELEDFVTRLQHIEESGFDTPELRTILAEESLDRWSGDGEQAPKNLETFYRAEQAWHVDINDGVRVNIAPLQLAGVLASPVLAKTTDAKKALTDRVRWRADERRWVRAGKLPRCGWMAEQIQASAAWLEREPSQQHAPIQQALMTATGEDDA